MSSRGGADLRRPDVLRAKAVNSRTFGGVLGAIVGLALIGGSAGGANAKPQFEPSASNSTVSLFGSAAPKTKSTAARAPIGAGRPVHVLQEWISARVALLQAPSEHRHPHRHAVERVGRQARSRDVQGRDRLGLADRAVRHPCRDQGQHDLHRQLPRSARPLCAKGGPEGACAESAAEGHREPLCASAARDVPEEVGREPELLRRRRLLEDGAAVREPRLGPAEQPPDRPRRSRSRRRTPSPASR